jgi:transcriptional regulator with XRE-family HTH domain
VRRLTGPHVACVSDTIGSRIRQARNVVGLTQYGLAIAIRMTAQMAHRWETNRAIPGSDAIVRIAQATGTSEGWLLTGSNETKKPRATRTDAAIREFLATDLSEKVEAWQLDALRECDVDALGPTLATIYSLWTSTDWDKLRAERGVVAPAGRRRRA